LGTADGKALGSLRGERQKRAQPEGQKQVADFPGLNYSKPEVGAVGRQRRRRPGKIPGRDREA